jgi:hypothetical protein
MRILLSTKRLIRIRILPINLMWIRIRIRILPLTSSQIWTFNCYKMTLYGFHLFTLMRIRILLFAFMRIRIRIQVPKNDTDPDPQHCFLPFWAGWHIFFDELRPPATSVYGTHNCLRSARLHVKILKAQLKY